MTVGILLQLVFDKDLFTSQDTLTCTKLPTDKTVEGYTENSQRLLTKK